MTTPYTHADHWSFAIKEGQQGRLAARKHVQVKKKTITYCAQIVGAWTTPDGLDCWTVESLLPEVARFTVPCRQVTDCPSSVCMCLTVKEDGAGAARSAPGSTASIDQKGMTVPVTRHPSLTSEIFSLKNEH